MSLFDYLAIGHISQDITSTGWKIGGTVSYSSQVAQALRCRTAVITSAKEDLEIASYLPHVQMNIVPAKNNTIFANQYTPAGRVQIVHEQAQILYKHHIPFSWQETPIVHLAPIANEIEPTMIDIFPNSFIGVTPQGWLRDWDEQGHVFAQDWPYAQEVLAKADAVILSMEDLLHQEMLTQYVSWASLLVLTEAEQGCTVFWNGETRKFPAYPVEVQELTGAGDVFATAFFVYMYCSQGNAWEAAQLANKIAAQSITATTLAEKTMKIQQYVEEIGTPSWPVTMPAIP